MSNISFKIIDAIRNNRWSEIKEFIEFHEIGGLTSNELFLLSLNLAFYGQTELLQLLSEDYECLKSGRYNGEALIPFSTDLESGVTLIGQTILGSSWGNNDTFESLKFLVSISLDVNGITFSGYTELQLAIVMSAKPHTEFLLQSGANPFMTSSDLDRPNAFDIAEDKDWAKKLLKKYT